MFHFRFQSCYSLHVIRIFFVDVVCYVSTHIWRVRLQGYRSWFLVTGRRLNVKSETSRLKHCAETTSEIPRSSSVLGKVIDDFYTFNNLTRT